MNDDDEVQIWKWGAHVEPWMLATVVIFKDGYLSIFGDGRISAGSSRESALDAVRRFATWKRVA